MAQVSHTGRVDGWGRRRHNSCRREELFFSASGDFFRGRTTLRSRPTLPFPLFFFACCGLSTQLRLSTPYYLRLSIDPSHPPSE